MRRSSLIGHVTELFDIIRRSRRPADGVVRDFYRTRRYLGSQDRRYISDALFAILRNFTLLHEYIEQAVKLSGRPFLPQPIPSIVYCAAYHAKILEETPEHLTPDIAGLWRVSVPSLDCERFIAVLSGVILSDQIRQDPLQRIRVQYSFPESVVAEWLGRYGVEETETLCRALNEPAPITIRVNTLKTTVAECQEHLHREGISTTVTALSPFGLVLEKRVNVHALHTFKRGFFEMQDEGSQLLSLLLEPVPNETICDACAGSGGKTLHLAALMQNRGTLVVVDVEERRLNGIPSRLERAGVDIVQLHIAERDDQALRQWNGKADRVLIDAPCTGVGTYRRNPAAKITFTDDFVASVSRTQRTVLQRYGEMVKPGGRLVYATCTLLARENEDMIQWFLETHPDFSLLSAPRILSTHGITMNAASPFLTLLPHKTTTDGFFAAVMTRQSSGSHNAP